MKQQIERGPTRSPSIAGYIDSNGPRGLVTYPTALMTLRIQKLLIKMESGNMIMVVVPGPPDFRVSAPIASSIGGHIIYGLRELRA